MVATDSSDRIIYVQIQEDFQLPNNEYFVARQQFVYVREQIASPVYIACEKCQYEVHYLALRCDETEVLIPKKFAFLTEECLDETKVNIFNYLQTRDMNKTTDYFKMVRDYLGIDMKQNYVPQYDRRYYDRLDLKVPGDGNRKDGEQGVSFGEDR